jgi:phosphoribosylaminoimidazole-succinocarboxamide synthase
MSEKPPRKDSTGEVAGEEAASVPSRIELSPDNIEQGLAKLVLTLIDFLRQLLERQAIRRMEGGTLSAEEIEQMGEALMKLEAKIRELAKQFGLSPADLNIDLGPLGRLR